MRDLRVERLDQKESTGGESRKQARWDKAENRRKPKEKHRKKGEEGIHKKGVT